MSNEELAMLVHAGDATALAGLWEQNRGLLYKLFSRYFPLCAKHHCEPDDLLQCGWFVICNAADSYDPANAWKFTAYLKRQVQLAVAETFDTRGSKQRPVEVSGNVPVGQEDGETELLDLQPDRSAVEAFEVAQEDVYTQQLHKALDDAMEPLTERQRTIIYRRFYEGHTYNMLAADYGVSANRMRQEQQKGLRRMGQDKSLRQYRENIITCHAYRGSLSQFRYRCGSSVELVAELLECL